MEDIADPKQRDRETWAAGDYDVIAEHILETGERIVERLGIGPSDGVLDVACGTGNATIPAARRGARVVGLDLTTDMLERAQVRAAHAGVDVLWVEADAEALPFEDESFDAVLSTFGCMFAPRHDVVAGEMARVLRRGGRLGMCNWTPEGAIGDFFQTLGSHLPPLEGAPPLAWGNEQHVRELLGSRGIELEFAREQVSIRYPSVADAVRTYEVAFGPVVKAREMLQPAGAWPAARDDMAAMFARNNSATDGTLDFRGEYLVVVGSKAA